MFRAALLASFLLASAASAEPLLAGAAKVDITKKTAIPAHDPLFVRALVLKQGDRTAVLLSLDVVSFGEIGHVKNDFLPKVRARLEKDLGIPPGGVIANASHCHGIPCDDVDEKTIEAVQLAVKRLVPVKAGTGSGTELRISENRRLKLKSGKEADVRHAYSLPADEEVIGLGPIDPQIGLLRLDSFDGKPVAVVYNFACHPIMGVPNGGNTADLTGYSSKVIEDHFGGVALFVQGCGGDINPVGYKDVGVPRDAEPLGNRLGLSAMDGLRKIAPAAEQKLTVIRESLAVPRADHTERIDLLVAEEAKLVKSLQGTTLNLKTFLELASRYNLAPEFPSADALRYFHQKDQGRDDLAKLDEANRAALKAYIANVLTMEKITRVQTNLALLRKHQKANLEAGRKPIDVDVMGLRVGEFVLVTFPGELTVDIGLSIKKRSPHKATFVAGYTNGYLYYTPTAKQMKNTGGAQEDSDCRVAPEWEDLFHRKVDDLLKKL